MRIKRLLCVLVFSLIFAACGGGQPGITPGVAGGSQTTGAVGHSAGHLIVMGGMRPDKRCPSGFAGCVTVSLHQPAQFEFCYTTGSACGPSLPQYSWYSGFASRKKEVNYFNGSFNPDPGNPTDDTISEVHGVKSTQGKYKYEQIVCPFLTVTCAGEFAIGIAVQ